MPRLAPVMSATLPSSVIGPPVGTGGWNLTTFRCEWEDRAVDVVCLGILVADVVCRPVDELPARGTLGLAAEIELHGGGCALNTASALARLGLRTAVAGKVGADRFGD